MLYLRKDATVAKPNKDSEEYKVEKFDGELILATVKKLLLEETC